MFPVERNKYTGGMKYVSVTFVRTRLASRDSAGIGSASTGPAISSSSSTLHNSYCFIIGELKDLCYNRDNIYFNCIVKHILAKWLDQLPDMGR